MKDNKIKRFTIDTVKGVTLGVSVAIPGLSAGTIAVSERCYDTIIDSMSGFRKKPKENFFILLPYLIGLLIGAICAFIGIKKGYEVAPFTLTGLFGGLVIGSLPVAIKELRKADNTKEKITFSLSFIISLIVSAGIGIITALCKISLEANMDFHIYWMYPIILIAGFLAAFACVVPGISGSMTLMIFGLYQPILSLFIGDKSIFRNHDNDRLITAILFILVLIIGAIFGLIVSSKLMKKLLKDYRVSTFYAILGLIIGSTISMFINADIYPKYLDNSIKNWDYIVGGVLLVVGISLSLGLVYLDKILNKNKEEDNHLETSSATIVDKVNDDNSDNANNI